MNVELLNNGEWTAEVFAATGREILALSTASVRRQDDVEPLDFHHAYAAAKQEKIGPTALHDELACRTDRGNVRRGVATESETCGNETGIWEVGAVIMVYFDLAGEDFIE